MPNDARETHFDTVVVGSGFGGSVVAARLAEEGRSVCLLERGKAYPPGSFPRGPAGLRDSFWDPSEGLHGMFDVWSFKGLEALVSAGLGGGSLIYANVLLRKDERWFVQDGAAGGYEHWPVTRADLEPHYDRVEERLAPARFPRNQPLYDVPKVEAFHRAAEAAGHPAELAPIAVTFANAGQPPRPGVAIDEEHPNLHGRTRLTCLLCGECDIGCNYGAKNTLDFNYLSDAKRVGADLRTRAEVRRFAPRDGGGYEVFYVEHREENEGRKTATGKLPEVRLTCDRLVLSAGTLGSPYLLLKNRGSFPALSDCLGTRFCGNGDLLGLFLGACDPKDRSSRLLRADRGPVITSYVRVGDELDGPPERGRGFYIQDGGHPEFVSWLVEAAQAPGVIRRFASFGWHYLRRLALREPRSDLSAAVRGILGSAFLSSCSLPVLGMGRDVPDGRMSLDRGYLAVDWTTKTSAEYFGRMRRVMRELADALGARYRDNPSWLLRRVITVHPLGGCPMGRDAREGVVDAWGEVFGDPPGLWVADGSVMPGPVGANPSLTIAALADRTADAMIHGKGARR